MCVCVCVYCSLYTCSLCADLPQLLWSQSDNLVEITVEQTLSHTWGKSAVGETGKRKKPKGGETHGWTPTFRGHRNRILRWGVTRVWGNTLWVCDRHIGGMQVPLSKHEASATHTDAHICWRTGDDTIYSLTDTYIHLYIHVITHTHTQWASFIKHKQKKLLLVFHKRCPLSGQKKMENSPKRWKKMKWSLKRKMDIIQIFLYMSVI